MDRYWDEEAGAEKYDRSNEDDQDLQESWFRYHAPQPMRSTEFLTGLRGLASFLVYISHQIPWWYGVGNALEHGFGYRGDVYFGQLPFVRTLFTGGNAAVAVFFVLSGYVLSITPLRLLRNRRQKSCLKHLISAFIRRPLRLYIPPLGVSLLFALIMQLPFGLSPKLSWPNPKDDIFSELKNWVFETLKMMNPFKRHGVYEPWYPYDPPAWTMAVEMEGSMLVFGIIAAFSFASPRYAAYLFTVTGIFLLLINQWALACFLGGIVLAAGDLDVHENPKTRISSSKIRSFINHVVFFTGWFLLGQPAGPRDLEFSSNSTGWKNLTGYIPSAYYGYEYWRFYTSIGAVLMVYSVLRIRWLQSFLTTRPILFLGKIAFCLYLIHIPFEWTLGDRIYRILGTIRQDFVTVFDNWLHVPDVGPLGLSTGFLLSQCILIPLNIMIAKFGTRLLDRPSVNSGKWLVSKLEFLKYQPL